MTQPIDYKMFSLLSWKFLLIATSLCQLAASQDGTCYLLKPASQRADLVCEKYGTLKRPAPLGDVVRESVSDCVGACINYPNGACKSIFYDYYTGCQLESKPPAAMGYNKPSNPDEYSFISNKKCYQPYQTSTFVNGNFSQGKDPWLSYGPVTFDTGAARVAVPYNATYNSTRTTNFQISQGELKLCPGKAYQLNYTQHLEHVKGTITIIYINQSREENIGMISYNISQPNKFTTMKTYVGPNPTGYQGDTYAIVVNGDITTTVADAAQNPSVAVVALDNFVLIQSSD